LDGVAKKLTKVPAHTGFAEAVMETPTGNVGFTSIVIVLELAGFPVTQLAFEVIEQPTASL